MEQQRVNIIPSIEEKGYSSPSRYRINSVVDRGECLMVTRFVQWDVEPLNRLSGSKVYFLCAKLNHGERMSCEEKNWLVEAVNANTYSRTAVPLMGYRFDFSDVLKKYLINRYGYWVEYHTPDRTNLRTYLYSYINQIVEIPKH